MSAPESTEVTLGEVHRGLTRVEQEMHLGFEAVRQQIRTLSFVPSGVYAADVLAYRDRLDRIETALAAEVTWRRDTEAVSVQRAWQSRLSIVLAMVSVLGAIVAPLIVAALK